jgi:hypothetical protein
VRRAAENLPRAAPSIIGTSIAKSAELGAARFE